jgi:ligand-binding SRPBCC domain-containing protein
VTELVGFMKGQPPRRMATQLQFEDWVPFPVHRVFTFFSNPKNLPRIMPAATHTELEQLHLVPPPLSRDLVASPDAAGVGSVIVTSFRPLPFLLVRARWIARITEFEWNDFFADIQQEGPFRRWRHRHQFLAEARSGVSGTRVRDEIEYEVGFGPLGALADALFVTREMRSIFAQRQKVLPGLLSCEE